MPPLLRTRLAAPRAARAGISSHGSRRFIRVPGPSRAQRLCPPCARVRTDPANPSVRLSQIALGSESDFCHACSRLRGGRLFEAPEHQEAFPPHPGVIDTIVRAPPLPGVERSHRRLPFCSQVCGRVSAASADDGPAAEASTPLLGTWRWAAEAPLTCAPHRPRSAAVGKARAGSGRQISACSWQAA